MPNRLAQESSPYLRQHAENPVDWWPWNDAALLTARTQNKPILLSIGYSACHWCHVMAHESFEDEATASVMNDLFICIKVDREERPDIDKIYQLAHQALTQRGGGWPLTVFITPDDHLPFYAGTYFPKQPRYGMPPFVHVLQQVRSFWDSRRDDVRAQNSSLAEFLADHGKSDSFDGSLSLEPIRGAVLQIEMAFDATYGGHRGAPKFPHSPEMELLFDLGATERADFTLQKMADGGIHDQLGGGFCRYSVDEHWEIPHFEKMLYDNAQLLPLYATMATNGNSAPARRAADGIVTWLTREMTSPHGGFYSALDADSEHEEGKFYVWQRDELAALLDAEQFAMVDRYFGFDRPPSFENHAWNPIVATSVEEVAESTGIASDRVEKLLVAAKSKMLVARSQRVRPGLDDKILVSWNALMIAGLARTSRILGDPTLQKLADRALDHLFDAAWTNEKLYATTATSPKIPAYLDDYAFLIEALLESLQTRWSERDLGWSMDLAESLLHHFEDRDAGGFFFTADDQEQLIQRPKPWMDEAIPSGNGVAARALLRLGHLIGETRFIDAAERTLRAAYSTLQQNPASCVTLQRALNDFLNPRTHVVIRFDTAEEESAWRAILSHDVKRTDIYFVPSDAKNLPSTIAAQKYTSGGVGYVCCGTRCLPPADQTTALRSLLSSG
ncbi:MAG: thioredoxin domain-containing protein [Rudaea sp.]